MTNPLMAIQENASVVGHYFTRDGSPEMENQIRQICQWVMTGLKTVIPLWKLDAVLLGGGYGRGEGGVFHDVHGDVLYNDLEFYVFIKGLTWLNEKQYGGALHRLAEELSAKAGIEVEFKVLSLGKFRRSEVSMFYYDLAVGHKLLYGQEELFRNCEHHRNAANIPLVEGTRLLMNRCSGLLLIKERARLGTLMPDYAERNLAKLQLALGDAVLTAYGRYHSSCLERAERLKQVQPTADFPWIDAVRYHHAFGVEFKLHPTRGSKSDKEMQELFEVLADLAKKTWLWLETRRLGLPFASARDYVLNPVNKCPEERWWRNWAVNVARLGPEMAGRPESFRYPRERLYNTLPALLWESIVEEDLKLMDHLQEQLRTFATTPPALVQAYVKLWERFR